MAFIKLRMTNEAGEDAGVLYVNTDQIVAISMDEKATALRTADGHTLWVKDMPDEIVALAKTPA